MRIDTVAHDAAIKQLEDLGFVQGIVDEAVECAAYQYNTGGSALFTGTWPFHRKVRKQLRRISNRQLGYMIGELAHKHPDVAYAHAYVGYIFGWRYLSLSVRVN